MLKRDFAVAVRSLYKKPGFALTAVLTIALGIGATTAIFSVVKAVLLNPLPYAEPDRLAIIWGDLRNRNVKDFPTAPGDFKDMRDQLTMFEGLAGLSTFRSPLLGDDGAKPEQIQLASVTPNLFSLLGVKVAAGRDFMPDDGTPQPAPPPNAQNAAAPGNAPAAQQGAAAPPPPRLPTIAILSDGFWRRRYGGDRGIIGKNIQLGNNSAQVVGILEPGVELLFPPNANINRVPDIWTSLRVNFDSASRINVFLRVIGRLKAGVTAEQAQSQVDRLSADLRQRFPIKQTAGLYMRVEPMQKNLVAAVRPAILALMGAVVFVLLIACANVANLLLVRAAWRERELALRSALGGSQWRLIREMLAESLVLAGAGGVLGLGLAWLGIQLLTALGPASLPRLESVRLDPLVLGFTALASLLAAALFGVVPAIRSSRPDALEVLKPSGRAHGARTGKWLRNGVVTAEVALSFILLIGSGLMVRSFMAVARTDPGFDPSGVLTFLIQPVGIRGPQQAQAFEQDFSDRLKAIPGVSGVTAASNFPLDGNDGNVRWGTPDAMADPTRFRQAQFFFVQPDYFTVMKTKLLAGRLFTRGDIPAPPPPPVPGAPPAQQGPPPVVPIVVDEWLVAKAFPNQPLTAAIDQTLMVRSGGPEPTPHQIIGVVQHQRHTTLSADEREVIYITGTLAGGNWAVRTAGNPLLLGPQIERVLNQISPQTPMADVRPMSTFVDNAIAPTRFALVLIGLFASIAGVLAVVGLYGVLSNVVRQRTSEIGVRVALGAPRGSILRLVVGHGLALSGTGIVLGLAGAFALTRLMGTMLVGVKATDPITYGLIATFFFGVAWLACWVPARRAAALDPTTALREE